MEKIRQTTPRSGLTKAIISQDGQPCRMSRSGGKGPRGSGNSLPPNKGGYGLGVGVDVVRMSRKGGSGASGRGFKLSAEGPARSGRTPGGTYSHQGREYGVAGVSGSGSSGYGVGGV